MRIDKFLWCVRLFKTRSLAAENCSKEKIYINGSIAKSSRTIAVGDLFAVKNLPIWKTYKVLNIPKTRVGAKALFEFIIETTSKEELDKLKTVQEMNKFNHSLGIKGRPTKKDRRDLDEFLEN